MKTVILLVTLALQFFLYSIASAQNKPVGYLGKKNAIGAGFTINSPISGFPHFLINDEAEAYNFPPKVFVCFEHNFTYRGSYSISGSYYGLPNTLMYAETYEYLDMMETQQYIVTDTFKLHTNMYSTSAGFKVYKEFAPMGKYTSFEVGLNYFESKVYPTTYMRYYIIDDYEKQLMGEVLYNDTAFTRTSVIFDLSIGKGIKSIIRDYAAIDFGVKSHLFLGRYNFMEEQYEYEGSMRAYNFEQYDHRANIDKIVDYIHNKRAYLSHLLEVYITIQFLK